MNKATIADLAPADLQGRRVLVRVDFNVPMKDGRVTDDTRLTAAIPTIRLLHDAGAITVLVSHLGRPKGVDEALRLAPVGAHLAQLLGLPVRSLPVSVGPEAEAAVAAAKPGDILLLENIRFHPEEEKNDPAFAQQLARLADLYVNDAFGTAHRAHASTAGVAQYLPAYAGLLMAKEVDYLGKALANPERPFVAIIGGAKISSKITVLEHLLPRVDALVVGGAMALTLQAAQGASVGRSLVEPDYYDAARSLIAKAKEAGKVLVIPFDFYCAADPQAAAPASLAVLDGAPLELAGDVPVVAGVPADQMALDIGPRSAARIAEVLGPAKTIVWNGPMGVFENPAFAEGTRDVARLCAAAGSRGAVTIVGGGDSVAAVEQMGLADTFSHVSTGGGATLEFLEGKILPGVAVLKERN
jgi:phosphoglycerate kinase